jgi:LEA14-like dessication related protein
MRQNRTLVIWLLLPVLISGCATLPWTVKPEVRDVRPRLTNIDFKTVCLAVEIDVYNPFPVAIDTVPIQYKIAAMERDFFDGEIIARTALPPKQTGTLTIPVTVAYSDLVPLGRVATNASKIDYRIYGYVNLPAAGNRYELPFSHRGSFPILRPPQFSTVKVELSDVSLSKACILADAEVHNPNVFELGVQDLTFVLNLGSAQITGLKASTGGKVAAGRKGRLTLAGEISAESGLITVLMKGISKQPRLTASGSLQTPYGRVSL